jgi:hypothetical protein
MAEKLMTPEFRMSYAWLLQPKKNKQDETKKAKYSGMIVLDKSLKSTRIFIAKLEKALLAASLEKHGKVIPKSKLKHWPIKDGDDGDAEGEVNPAHEGCWCINASSNRKPQVIDRKGRELLDEEEVYSGMWCKATIHCWGWDNPASGKGVSVDLDNVMKTKDDEKLGGSGTKAEDDFADELEDGDDDEEDDDEDEKPVRKPVKKSKKSSDDDLL